MSGTAFRSTVLLAVALATGLCTARLTWGLADGRWFPDEFLWVFRLDHRIPPEMATTRDVGLVYPTLFEFASALTCRLAGGCAPATGDVAQMAALLRARTADPGFVRVLTAARATSALMWVAGVVAAAALGRRLYDARTGAIAALRSPPARSRSCRCTPPASTRCSGRWRR